MTPDQHSLHEQGYIDGQRAVWISLLRQSIRELDHDREAGQSRWIIERAETIQALRTLCGEIGGPEAIEGWPDDPIYLPDLISKHLTRILEPRKP